MSRFKEYFEKMDEMQANSIAKAADLIQRYCNTLRDNEDLSFPGIQVLAKIEQAANEIMEYAAHE